MTLLFRSMKSIGGRPAIGPSSRTLGVRPELDIVVDNGMVNPKLGGMSVSPDDPRGLPVFRRPPAFGGTGRDPVFVIDERDLGPDLIYRADPRNAAGHGFIEHARPVTFDDYQAAISATIAAWRRYDP